MATIVVNELGRIGRSSPRYTEWTAEPPKRVRFWNRTGAKPALWAAIVLTPLMIGIVIIGFICLMSLLPGFGGFLFLLMATVAVLIPSAAISVMSRDTRSGTDVRDLMDLPPTVRQYPVSVGYKVGTTRYGRDVGVLGFTGDRVHFQGRRSRFDFSKATVADIVENPKGRPGRVELRYGLLGSSMGVQIVCFDSTPGVAGGFQSLFAGELEQWRHAVFTASACTVLPPLKAESRYISQVRTMVFASMALVVLICAAFVGCELSAPMSLNQAGGMGLYVLLCCCALLGAKQHVKNMKRLHAIDEGLRLVEREPVRSAQEEQAQKMSL